MGTDLGRVSEDASADADQALVSDQAASRLDPSGFDPSRRLGRVIFPRLPDLPPLKNPTPWQLSERALAQIAEIARHSHWPFRR